MAVVERYVHSIPKKHRKWDQGYLQFVCIDPGQVNFAFRIERRYDDGRIIPIAFWKQAFRSSTYQNLIKKLDEFKDEYINTHVVLIEKQPPRSVTINRIMQHAITYFMVTTKDYPLLPEINEVNPHLKGNELGANPDENLKKWASKEARRLLTIRKDAWSLEIMDHWLNPQQAKGERKDDDLADTIVMIEAYCKKKNHRLTKAYEPPRPRKIVLNKSNVNSISPHNNKPKIKINRVIEQPTQPSQPSEHVPKRKKVVIKYQIENKDYCKY